MNNQQKQLIGSWIQAGGTVIAAFGSTPSQILTEEDQFNLSLWGNVLQGVGNALVADGTETVSLSKLGNEVQAIGNTTVVGGMLIDFKEETKKILIIDGNWLQAVGGGMAAADAIDDEASLEKALNVIGNLLQVIGNSLQAIAGIYELKKSKENENDNNTQKSTNQISYYQHNNSSKEDEEQNEGEALDFSGSWIQAVGAVISAIAQTISTNS
ncbi:DUF6944 family repetitive protein [Cytobacillus massiliigabonensis]|uniref:DUF6944 family repetitive protein n=1 Tax=Cytobacillus massiliigabonensis TaxID=1871011 RepID=UPI000C827F05|nr:hypothetical protein [Cytobacillus massiliigabonensis]